MQAVTGELGVRGPTVFSEYFGKPEATAKEFDAEGFFRTGDIAEYSPQVCTRSCNDVIVTTLSRIVMT